MEVELNEIIPIAIFHTSKNILKINLHILTLYSIDLVEKEPDDLYRYRKSQKPTPRLPCTESGTLTFYDSGTLP